MLGQLFPTSMVLCSSPMCWNDILWYFTGAQYILPLLLISDLKFQNISVWTNDDVWESKRVVELLGRVIILDAHIVMAMAFQTINS